MTLDDDLLAGEHALGLLDGDDAMRATQDFAFGQRVAWWREQLAPLADEAETTPPAATWSAISRRLPANDNDAAARWRSTAIGLGAVAAALLLFVGVRPPETRVVTRTVEVEKPSPLVAALSGKDGTAVGIAYDGKQGEIGINPEQLKSGERIAELWVIPGDGKPRSLGTFDAGGRVLKRVTPEIRAFIADGATLAVSLEPPGGSPTGSPTGPVVATGKIITS